MFYKIAKDLERAGEIIECKNRNLSANLKWPTHPLVNLRFRFCPNDPSENSTEIHDNVICNVTSSCLLSGSSQLDNSRCGAVAHTRASPTPSPTPNVSLQLFSRYTFRHDRWDFSAFHRRRVEPRGTCQRFPSSTVENGE